MKVLFDMHMNNDFDLNKIKIILKKKKIDQSQNDYIYCDN